MAIPMSALVEGAAGNLVPSDFETDVVELILSESQVVGRIPSIARWALERLDDTIPVTYDAPEPEAVSEDGIKPTDVLHFKYIDLTGTEVAMKVPMTNRLLDNSVVSMDRLVARQAAAGFAKVLDTFVMGTGTPAWGTNPDFLTSAIAAGHNLNTGSGLADLFILFSQMLAELEAHDGFDKRYAEWFVSAAAMQTLRDARDTDGRPLLVPDAFNADSPPRIYNLPVNEVATARFPSGYDVFLVDLSKAEWATKYDTIRSDVSNVAAWTGEDGNLRSAFERNETIYKFEGYYAFSMASDEFVSVAYDIELVG